MEEEDEIRYETLFYCQKLEDGFLSGDVARALFIRSKLPLPDLTKIWKLSDISNDNKLDVFEFSIAMHLIELKLCGHEIPKQLVSSVLPNHVKDVIIPVMTEPEKNLLKKVFEQKDRRSQGYLERDVVQPLLLASGLSSSLLTKIWNIADLDRDGRLSFLEFAIALHLVKNCINGVSLDGPVNPFICIPEEEGAIVSCKEKLKIFDKEFLLEQKENEKETFSNFCELNDLDLDLLAEYLPDVVALNKGKRETDHVDNTSYQNALHVQRQEKGFDRVDTSSKVKSCVEPSNSIECHRVTGNELEIDLDAIFQAVEAENENNFNEEPKYIARSAQSEMAFSAVADDMEEDYDDDDHDAPPVTQKRTYFGKQLIFEDPIGSEIIGDVEFEVDFDVIVKDIERESVDEERRLPIARVLPIYKSVPVVNEQPFEKKTASKDIREIDLDFNMNNESITGLEKKGRDDSSDFDRTIILNSIIGRITNESQHAGAQEKLNLISCKESQDYNYEMLTNNSKKVNGTKNSYNSHEEDIPIDIVEEKRLLMQRQMEERKKLREKELNNRENIISSESLEPNSVGNTRIKGKSSKKELNEPSAKEEKEEKIRNAEEKERLLLGRIKYLERKREMLLEKKQQELKLKNTERENVVLTNKQGIQKESISCEGDRMVEVMSNTYMLNSNPIDSWSQNSGPNVKTSSNSLSNEEEKKRLDLALETKRKSDAELEKRRQDELREAERRRLEQEASEEKERQSAKERKRNFMENLTKLKERVIKEEATWSGMSDPKKHRSLKADGSLKKNMSDKQKLTSSSQSYADTQLPEKRHGIMNEMDKNNTSLNQLKKHGKDEIQKLQTNGSNTPSSPEQNNEENEENEQLDEVRRENFKSNRELFMKKVESEKNTEISKREKKNKARPKSFYGGMFNRSVHQIIDDDDLARDASLFEEDTLLEPDLVDKEALAQYHREKEFMKEHERVSKHQRSLNRDTSYTKENVEKLWTTETDNLLQNDPKECSQQKEKPLSNTNRRSLVNTLTTEWNSFLDILEGDDRWESETVKKRQEISTQRKTSTTGREKNAEIKHELTKDAKKIVECHVSSTKSEQSEVESDLEILARQSGNVKKMEEHIQDESHDLHQTKQLLEERTVLNKTMTPARSQEDEPLKNDDVTEIKRQQQKRIIKDNAPKRKFDMAHVWTDVVSHQ